MNITNAPPSKKLAGFLDESGLIYDCSAPNSYMVYEAILKKNMTSLRCT